MTSIEGQKCLSWKFLSQEKGEYAGAGMNYKLRGEVRNPYLVEPATRTSFLSSVYTQESTESLYETQTRGDSRSKDYCYILCVVYHWMVNTLLCALRRWCTSFRSLRLNSDLCCLHAVVWYKFCSRLLQKFTVIQQCVGSYTAGLHTLIFFDWKCHRFKACFHPIGCHVGMLAYTADELLSINSAELCPVRSVRKAIYSHRLRRRCPARSVLPHDPGSKQTSVNKRNEGILFGLLNTHPLAKNRSIAVSDTSVTRHLDVLALTETWHETSDDIQLSTFNH